MLLTSEARSWSLSSDLLRLCLSRLRSFVRFVFKDVADWTIKGFADPVQIIKVDRVLHVVEPLADGRAPNVRCVGKFSLGDPELAKLPGENDLNHPTPCSFVHIVAVERAFGAFRAFGTHIRTICT